MSDPEAGPSPAARVRPKVLRWFPEFLEFGRKRIRTQLRLLSLAFLLGVITGVGAIAFYLATEIVAHFALGGIAGYHPEPHPGGEPLLGWLGSSTRALHPWLLILVPAVGGILSGVLVFTLAPEAEGHGTDSVIESYHHKQGYIRPRVPLVKIVASAITIGTGGSGGREGPIAQIGAGVGSYLAGLLRLKPADRRVLMAAGMGAGIAAIFRAPLAGALFAAEVLYRSPEFEPEVIIPAGLTSVVSYCTFGVAFGWKPLFVTPDLTFTHPLQLGAYLFLALFMILLATLYTRSFYGFTALFHRLPIPRIVKPALGALLSGVAGVGLYFLLGRRPEVLSVLSFGYNALQHSLTDEVTVSGWVLLAIAVGKIMTTGLTIGSGGSGGVFGPSMVIGGCGGGALGVWLHGLWPHLVPHPASFVIIGMGGFFAAAAKTPFSTLVIISEMTGSYHLLLPALWVCMIAFLLSDEQSIYRAQVEGRAKSPAHQGSFVRQALAGVTISKFIDPKSTVIPLGPETPLGAIIDRFDHSDFSVLPVADSEGRLVGVVSLEDVHTAAREPAALSIVCAVDVMRYDVTPLTPEDRLDRALEHFVEDDLLALPLVSALPERKLLGMVKRFDIASAYLRHMHKPDTQRMERPALGD
jgi:CIC family chloride channel protein